VFPVGCEHLYIKKESRVVNELCCKLKVAGSRPGKVNLSSLTRSWGLLSL
jgi:hypothetical protein